ncbi:hypothetical protein HHI36_005977 [Cryptolaemus montrouzieri]|uniref:Uncharacterized protein n=1 Tax=Cryptolaemus montrouzieri TaxID=559131 RepID=A0ABD2NW79_9CUCU
MKSVRYKDYRHFSEYEFNEHMSQIDWQSVITVNSIDASVQCLNSILIDVFDVHAPYKTITVRRPARSYINNEIEEMIARKNKAHLKFVKNGRVDHRNTYIQLKNYVSFIIRKAKKVYINQELNAVESDS